MPGEYNIQIDENAVPVIHPPRKVPIVIKEQLRQTLKRMEK